MKINEYSLGDTELLLGNDAIARGAVEGDVRVAASYPGTPASEIMETLSELPPEMGVHTEWSTNEKVAFEVATGASITGVRSLVSMKNAGLNWIMDPFMTIVYGGIRGGFTIVVADDPGAHYSSNEQDTRLAAAYAEIPCLEPSDQQEAKEMTKRAFSLSEKIELPVYVRSVTRVSHALGEVEFGEVEEGRRDPVFDRHYEMPYRWNVYGDSGPVERHGWLKEQQELVAEEMEDLPWNESRVPEGADFGVIASGIGASYAREVLESTGLSDEVAFLKIGTPHPMPESLLIEFLREVGKALIVEEGLEFVERRVREIAQPEALDVGIYGRLTGHIPPVDEIDTGVVVDALENFVDVKNPYPPIDDEIKEDMEELITPRSATFCAGCPHLGTYWALRRVLEDVEGVQIINGDIGCYEMAGYGLFSREIEASKSEESVKHPIESSYEILDTNYVMGSGIGLMQGQYQAAYDDGPLIAVTGDSTFFHSVLPEVTNAVYNGAEGLLIVLDNRWTAMTGHHPNPGSGERVTGERSKPLDIEEIVRALGVEKVRKVDSYDLEKTAEAIEEGIGEGGFSVVICRRPCTIEALRREDFERIEVEANPEECISCEKCVELGCPAITYEREKGGIDRDVCVDCGLCAEICPTEALRRRE